MKFKTVILTMFLSVVLVAYTQNSKTVKKNGVSITEYYLVDKKTKLKDGLYVRINERTKDTLAVGNYANDIKSGNWRYFSAAGMPYITYNYSTDSIHFLSDAITSVRQFIVKTDTTFILTDVDRAPVYTGDFQEVYRTLAENISVPRSIAENNKTGNCFYTITISKDGRIVDITTKKSLSKDIDKQVAASFAMLHNNWLPALCNGKAVDAQINLLVNISNNNQAKKQDEKPYFYFLNLVYYSTVNIQ